VISKSDLAAKIETKLYPSIVATCQAKGTYDIDATTFTCTKPCPLPKVPGAIPSVFSAYLNVCVCMAAEVVHAMARQKRFVLTVNEREKKQEPGPLVRTLSTKVSFWTIDF
jgi:hypothetical protein